MPSAGVTPPVLPQDTRGLWSLLFTLWRKDKNTDTPKTVQTRHVKYTPKGALILNLSNVSQTVKYYLKESADRLRKQYTLSF